MNKVRINVKQQLSSPEVATDLDGRGIQLLISTYFRTNRQVELDFTGMTNLPWAFLNTLLGPLPHYYTRAHLEQNLTFTNLSEDSTVLMHRMLNEARKDSESLGESQFIRLDGNWSEGFTPIGPYGSFDDASEAAEASNTLTWITQLKPAAKAPASGEPEQFIMLAGNPSDGITVHGPYPNQLAALEDAEKQWHDTWIMTLQSPTHQEQAHDLPEFEGSF